jgi:hypothetical protein
MAVTRSFRLDKAYSEMLMKEAHDNGVSLSSLLGKIIKDYLALHAYAEKYSTVMMSQQEVDALIGSLSEEDARSLGGKMGSMTPISLLLMRGMSPPDLDSLIWLLEEIYGKRMGWFSIYNNVVDNDRVLYLTHNLSKNWTAFLGGYMLATFESVLGLKVSQEFLGTSIAVRIPLLKEKRPASDRAR